ncbi:MAG TPA: glycosyltransferase family 2 protein [Thermoanaerobaculia bacterium]|nr:glycosyltransferase family 2 protein [Thermoanaerobaculia bacterium]
MFEVGEAAPPRPRTRALDLSILIVTWNSERWIDRCLRSIPAACEGLAYEVVVHDNASGDGTVTHVGAGFSPPMDADGLKPAATYVLRSTVNAGFAAGTNRAFAASRGRYVFLLNPDCELAPHALTELFEFLETHPQVAAAVPLLVDEGGDSQREFQIRRLPTLGRLAAEVLMVDKLFPRNPATARYRYRDLGEIVHPQRIEQPAAAALLLRREVVEEIGPLDEQFAPAWFEDVDYCMRLAKAKKEVWVVPEATVRHFGGASLEHIHFSGFVDIWYRNMWRYAKKWMRPGQAEMLRWAIVAGMMMRCVVGLAGLRPRGVSRAEAHRAYSGVLKKAFDRWDDHSRSSS